MIGRVAVAAKVVGAAKTVAKAAKKIGFKTVKVLGRNGWSDYEL